MLAVRKEVSFDFTERDEGDRDILTWKIRQCEDRTNVVPPGGFEPPSPDPKSCMIDRYTTGVTEMNLRLIPAVSTLIFYAL